MRVGSIELKVQRNVQYTGRKSRVGRICFDEDGRMVHFISYSPCCNTKLVATRSEAEKLVSAIGYYRRKPFYRLMNRIIKKYQT